VSEQKFYITPTGNEITIREGKAVEQLPLKEPKIINISGDIHTISAYISKRGNAGDGHSSQAIDTTKVVVVVDKKARTITMSLDPENHYGATVTGKLEESDEIKPFFINQEKKFDRAQLIKLIKFSRIFFNDREKHAQMLESLYKLRIKTESELQQENDNRGNKKNSFERNIIDSSGFAQFFTLNIPLFKGFEAQKVQVEICYEPSETGILFWLESPELVEITQSQVNSIFEKELDYCASFVVVYR
jgi:hypothetical protein